MVVGPIHVNVAPLLTHHICVEKCVLVLHALARCGLDTLILFLIFVEGAYGHIGLAYLMLDVVEALVFELRCQT